jgi:hypothetical protein
MARLVPSLIVLVVCAAGLASARARPPAQAADPDQLYDAREVLASARAAADAWAARLAEDPDDFEAAWKLARAAYWLGAQVPERERRTEYERGLDAGRRAIELRPKRPEGRFWLAATMGAMAESFGLRAGKR